MSTEANKQIVIDFMKYFSANDMEKALGLMAEDATWWVAGSFPLSGTKTKAQFKELLAGVGGAMPGGIRLTATTRSSWTSIASNTDPIPPRPISRTSRYLPA